MKTLPPAERPLPGKAEILERILSDTTAHASGRRRQGWLVPVAAAAGVALVAGGILVVTTRHDASPADGTPVRPSTPAAPSTPAVPKQRPAAQINVNAGSLTAVQKAAAAQACIAPQEGPHRPTAITHGIKVRTWGGGPADATVAFTSPNGLRYACVGTGTGSMMTTSIVGGDPAVAAEHKTVLPVTDATHPAAPAEGTGATWAFVDFDRQPDQLARDGWYGVDDRVASMRQRWVVRGKTGPWFVAEPVDGLVFLRSWDRSAALKLGEEVRVETQVLGHNGELLDAPAGLERGRLTASPGTTRVDRGKVVLLAGASQGELDFR
jgi:hypothetical protein